MVVRHIRASSKRFDIFKDHVKQAQLKHKLVLVLDVPMRWNSNILCWRAKKFQVVFDSMSFGGILYYA